MCYRFQCSANRPGNSFAIRNNSTVRKYVENNNGIFFFEQSL